MCPTQQHRTLRHQNCYLFVVMSTGVSAPGKNILLVDDDPSVRKSMKLLLSIDQHTVTEAASGHEALMRFTGSRYDVVIIDYYMPEMLGDELAANIKNLAPGQPILMVTAYVEKLVNGGRLADSVLGKPVSVEDLRRAMAKLGESGTAPDTAGKAVPLLRGQS